MYNEGIQYDRERINDELSKILKFIPFYSIFCCNSYVNNEISSHILKCYIITCDVTAMDWRDNLPQQHCVLSI